MTLSIVFSTNCLVDSLYDITLSHTLREAIGVSPVGVVTSSSQAKHPVVL